MTTPKPNHDELSSLLELATDAVDVNRSAKTDARAAMLLAYRDAAASDGAGAVGPDAPAARVVGQAELVRLSISESARPRRVAVLAAVAAALVVGVAISISVRQPSRVEVGGPSPTSLVSTSAATTVDDEAADAAAIAAAEKIGLEFMQARADHDGELLVSLTAPNAVFGASELAKSVQDYPLQSEWERIVGWQFLDVSCRAGSPDRVVCTYSVQDTFNQQAGKGPFTGTNFLLGISDGRIVSVNHNIDNIDVDAGFFAESEVKFFAWVRENHPEDLDLMLDGDRLLGGPFRTFVLLTPESIQLWTEHTAEYLDTLE